MNAVLKCLRIIVGVFCGCMSITSIVLAFTEDTIIVFVIIGVIFGIPTYLCFRKKKVTDDYKSSEEVQQIQSNQHDVKTMNFFESDNIRVISESYHIMQNTKNIRTLCSRYEVGLQKCHILKQLGNNQAADQWIQLYTQNYYKLIKNCHDRFISEVKTETGKKNRSQKFWYDLFDCVDEYTLKDIREYMS